MHSYTRTPFLAALCTLEHKPLVESKPSTINTPQDPQQASIPISKIRTYVVDLFEYEYGQFETITSKIFGRCCCCTAVKNLPVNRKSGKREYSGYKRVVQRMKHVVSSMSVSKQPARHQPAADRNTKSGAAAMMMSTSAQQQYQ